MQPSTRVLVCFIRHSPRPFHILDKTKSMARTLVGELLNQMGNLATCFAVDCVNDTYCKWIFPLQTQNILNLTEAYNITA